MWEEIGVGPKASRPRNIIISTKLNTLVKESILDRVLSVKCDPYMWSKP